jgi:Alginate lyase/Right handed beta helix region
MLGTRRDCGHRIRYLLISASLFIAHPALSKTLYVSPGGQNEAAGTIEAPWQSIQKALEAAHPGDEVQLLPGRYLQDVRSVRDGTAGRPIVIKGPPEAIVSGAGETRVVEVNHDYVELHGFTIDGRHEDGDDRKESYRDILLYVIGAAPGDGVEGLRVMGVTFRNAGGECLRLRYSARGNEVAYSHFERCGVLDFVFDDGGKNGEAIYIGTAPEQIGKRGAPDSAPDRSDGNWIHHNTFNTQGNECVDIKEGSSGNIVEHNTCTGQRDRNSGGLGSRGNGNIFRYNTVHDNRGAGIRVGGDSDSDGVNNDIYGNTFRNNAMGAVRVQRSPQGRVCGNSSENDGEGAATGSFGKEINPTSPCPDRADAPGTPAVPQARNPDRADAPVATLTVADDGRQTKLRPPVGVGSPGRISVEQWRACDASPEPLVGLATRSKYDSSDPTSSTVDKQAEQDYQAAIGPLRSYQKRIVDWANDHLEGQRKGRDRAACVYAWLHRWAAADALRSLPTHQARFNRDGALASVAIAYLQVSALGLPDESNRRTILEWFRRLAEDSRDYYEATKLARSGNNNHRYWAALGVAAAATALNDRALLEWALQSYRDGVCSATPEGALPLEMERGKRALEYQLFALTPLVALAEFATANGLPAYEICGGALHSIVSFALAAIDDPSRLEAVAGAPQERPESGEVPATRLVFLEPYLKRFPDRHPEWIARIQRERPVKLTMLGGDVTLVWAGVRQQRNGAPATRP